MIQVAPLVAKTVGQREAQLQVVAITVGNVGPPAHQLAGDGPCLGQLLHRKEGLAAGTDGLGLRLFDAIRLSCPGYWVEVLLRLSDIGIDVDKWIVAEEAGTRDVLTLGVDHLGSQAVVVGQQIVPDSVEPRLVVSRRKGNHDEPLQAVATGRAEGQHGTEVTVGYQPLLQAVHILHAVEVDTEQAGVVDEAGI